MDDRAYWIWAQQAFHAGSPLPMRISQQYAGGLREFWEGGPKLWNSRRDLPDNVVCTLRDFSLDQAQARLEYALRIGWKVVTPGCEGYPALLENIPDPPAVLYYKGRLPDVDRRLSIAVVGSRKATPASADAARHFGYQLAAGGACVVSGGAVGVDAGALTGALSIPGAGIISVLPVSLDSGYVTANVRLRNMICQRGGALVTEYFSQERPFHGTFPVRNRLITGLSRGVVIVQAAKKSGSMIYASHAADQNRDVFVYPGPPGDPLFAGSQGLIGDGAMPVTCGEAVLASYKGRRSQPPAVLEDLASLLERPKEPPAQRSAAAGKVPAPTAALSDQDRVLSDPSWGLSNSSADLPPDLRRVWAALEDAPLGVAQLEGKTGLPASTLLGLLTQLELEGLAQSFPGKRYSRGQ